MKQLLKNYGILLEEFSSPKRLTTVEQRVRLYECLAETIQAIRWGNATVESHARHAGTTDGCAITAGNPRRKGGSVYVG